MLAAAAMVAAYSLLLALRDRPEPTPLTFPGMPQPLEIQQLPPLPRAPVVQPAAASDAPTVVGPTGDVEIAVLGTIDAPLGVRLVHGRTGSLLGWQELDAIGAAERRLQFAEVPVGDHFALLTARPGDARFSYLDRAAVQVTEASRGTAELRALVGAVKVNVSFHDARDPSRTLFRLTRRDDKDWRATPEKPVANFDDPVMLLTKEDGLLQLRDLGPGVYLLAPADSEQWLPIEVTIPGPTVVEAVFSLK